MELYQLRSFVAVAEARHLTRASEKLRISQPAVTAHVKALEEAFGLALFDRTSSGMELTPAGARLLAATHATLNAVQAMCNVAKALRGEVGGRVRVGTSSDPGFIRVGQFLGAVMQRHPLLHVELHQEVTGAAFAKVLDGDLDASFYYGDLDHQAINGLRLRASAYRLAAPAAWSGRLRRSDWNQIAQLPWIVAPPISSHHNLVRRVFAAHAIEPTKLIEADQELVIANLVVSGVGVSLIREELALAKEAAGEVWLWPELQVESAVWFIYLRTRSDDPVICALLGVLRDLWQITECDCEESSKLG